MEGLVGILGGLQCVSKVTDLREQLVTSYNHEARLRSGGTRLVCWELRLQQTLAQ